MLQLGYDNLGVNEDTIDGDRAAIWGDKVGNIRLIRSREPLHAEPNK